MLNFDCMGRDMHCTNKSMLTTPHPKEISERVKLTMPHPKEIWQRVQSI
jgi:hypothetical protein